MKMKREREIHRSRGRVYLFLSVTEGVIESMKNRGRVRKSKWKIVVLKTKIKICRLLNTQRWRVLL